MKLRLRRLDVGTLLDEVRRQAQRQILGQLQPRKIEGLADLLARKAADERRQQIALLRELLLQTGQGRLRRVERRLLRQHSRARRRAEFELPLQQIELLLLVGDDFLRCRDLCTQRCLLDGCRHDIRADRQIGGFELVLLIFRLRLDRFELAPLAAEDVDEIRDVQRTRGQGEDRILIRLAKRRAGNLLTCG